MVDLHLYMIQYLKAHFSIESDVKCNLSGNSQCLFANVLQDKGLTQETSMYPTQRQAKPRIQPQGYMGLFPCFGLLTEQSGTLP